MNDLPTYPFEDRPLLLAQATGLSTDLGAELERIERKFLSDAVDESGGVQANAAKRPGITERSLWHRVKNFGIRVGKRMD